MKIRADDPLSMKNFILGVQSRVNELKASAGEGQKKINNKRVSLYMFFLLKFLLSLLPELVIIYLVVTADGVHA